MIAFPLILPVGILGFGLPGYTEIIIIALVILLLFGGKKLPELAKGMAKGLRLFKDELKGIKNEVADVTKEVKDLDLDKDIDDIKQSQSSEDKPDRQDEK